MNTQITHYDNRGKAVTESDLRHWRVEDRSTHLVFLHPMWIFIAIGVGFAVGIYCFGNLKA